jgi:hypothetical protein
MNIEPIYIIGLAAAVIAALLWLDGSSKGRW